MTGTSVPAVMKKGMEAGEDRKTDLSFSATGMTGDKERQMDWRKETLDYYDQAPERFAAGTLTADMSDTRSRFAAHLPPNGLILDFGCGSGRDTKAFLEAGFRVEAIDGSAELCALASAYTGIQVRNMLFRELDEVNRYDGIWACASILHLPRTELVDVLGRLKMALKTGGILYASFKYGTFEGMRTGRYFTDFTEETLKAFWEPATSMKIFDLWITEDVRPGRKEEKWINLLARSP